MLASLASAQRLPDVIDAVRPSIVGVGTAYPPRQPGVKGNPGSYVATGFVVGNGVQVVTNAHAIPSKLDTRNNEQIAVFIGRGAEVTARLARVLEQDVIHDLALLEIDGPPLPALQLGNADTVREGQEVAFTGYPIGVVLGLYPATHKGIVAAITPVFAPVGSARSLDATQIKRRREPFDVFQLDAIAYPGNSGSPVYEPGTGRVIGVLNSVFVKESRETVLEKPSGISFAIPVRHLEHLLDAP